MTTSKTLQQEDFFKMELEESMSLPEASRAKMSVRQGVCGSPQKEPTHPDLDSGVSLPVLLAKLDRATQSWKTSQISLLEMMDDGSDEYSVIWPKSGSMRSGIAYQLPALALPIAVNESGLLPTPASRDYKGAVKPETIAAKGRNAATNSLPDAVEYRGQRGRLNPAWTEWLMGYPVGWTELKQSVTRLSRKSRKS